MSYSSKLRLAFFGLTILFYQDMLFGQDIVPYGLYYNNWKVVNPASTGLSESQQFDVAYRTNNTEVDNHPSYVLLSYENRLSRLNSGLGIIFENQQTGIRTRVFGKALYNYQIQLSDEKKFSIGAGFGFLSETLNSNALVVNPNDPILDTSSSPSNAFDMDLGIAFKSKKFQGGVSIRNLLESEIENSEIRGLPDNTVQHLTAHAEYILAFTKFRFIPSTYLYTDYDDILFDINPTFEMLRFLLIGGTLRVSDDDNFVNVNAGFNWKNKIRIMGIVYSSGYEGEGNNYEFNLSVRIDKK